MQATRYGFIEAARRDFDGVFRAVRVETRYFASSKTHAGILAFRFSFARPDGCAVLYEAVVLVTHL
jgi:hypothetical protein